MKKTATFLGSVGLCVLASPLFGAHAFAQGGIWISAKELASLPTSGPAWEQLRAAAIAPLKASPNLSGRARENVQAVAKALYYARVGDAARRDEVRDAIAAVMGTEGSDDLATFRALGGWIIAADLIDLNSMDPSLDSKFRDWLRTLLDPDHGLKNRSLVGTHEVQKGGNNWGTAAGFSRAAAASYLRSTDGDAELIRAAQVFKGYLGDRDESDGDSYTLPDSNFRSLSWQCDPSKPVGINPKGCTRDGHSIDGVLPDDQRRGGDFTWPPPKENYVYTGLQGVLPQAEILFRAGYDVWNWEDRAILRAFEWLHEEANFPATDDDEWLPHMTNHYYGTDFPAAVPAGTGKMMGWTDWTHGPDRGASPRVDKTPSSPPTGLRIF